LLLKYQQQLTANNAASTGLLASSCCATSSSAAQTAGQYSSSRRGTRDAVNIGGKAAGKGSHARTGGGSKLSRPGSALPTKGASTSNSSSRPVSANVAAAAVGDGEASSSRRTTRRKAPPKSPQTSSSMSGGNTSTGASNSSSSGGSANSAAAAAAAAVAASGSLGVTDEELLERLLAASTPQQAAAVYASLGQRHAASVLQMLAGMPRGEAAVAALLGCLSPVVAVRWAAKECCATKVCESASAAQYFTIVASACPALAPCCLHRCVQCLLLHHMCVARHLVACHEGRLLLLHYWDACRL
jgi:hypothetical protein